MRSVPAAAYLSEMREAFSRALEAADTQAEATLRIDDVAIRLLLAGAEIASAVLPALAPVLVETGAAFSSAAPGAQGSRLSPSPASRLGWSSRATTTFC